MAKFNLDNYETVEDRLKKFWKDFPKGRIDSNVVHITDDGTCVTIRTEIYKDINDDKPVTTGIAQETKGQGGFANADAWMENCETSSIGRALANWNYQGSTKPRPSREEMSKVQVEKKPVKKPTKQEQEAMEKVVDEMVAEPTNTTGDVGKQLNQLLEAMIPDESLRQTIKGNAYNELVSNGLADKDIKLWTKKNMDVFMTRVEDMFDMQLAIDNKLTLNTDTTDIVEEVFGEVTELVVRTCPDCNSPDWIEDNREKKQSDPDKFGAIPSWSCSTYQSNKGCGWTAWGDTDCPKEWL
mgnify:CR=1 FL=1|tara:strand:- start:3143 stop:4033 length:891 start_codon:yes stop_codon:yes gene_type:complete